ncbi:MAG: hypothetical protein KGZ74_02405 [Chitinophagaceae bacterium]|nr:hypothetical protein [Chitinophagaceae bacterium]
MNGFRKQSLKPIDINTNIDEGENIHRSGGIVLKFAVREKQLALKRDESG